MPAPMAEVGGAEFLAIGGQEEEVLVFPHGRNAPAIGRKSEGVGGPVRTRPGRAPADRQGRREGPGAGNGNRRRCGEPRGSWLGWGSPRFAAPRAPAGAKDDWKQSEDKGLDEGFPCDAHACLPGNDPFAGLLAQASKLEAEANFGSFSRQSIGRPASPGPILGVEALMKRVCLSLAFSFAVLAASFAWDNHSQLSYLSLGSETWALRRVKAESLGDFVLAVQAKLPGLLQRIEAASIRDIPEYRPLPAALAFLGGYPTGDGGAAAKAAFIAAIRVNPAMPFPLYVQLQAGGSRPPRPDLPVTAADLYDNRVPNPPFQAIMRGEQVSALEVVASASDEPDYGMDIGLFSDNKSPVAGLYGFGTQAFGNPALPYGSQAPFHMAFAHEDPLIKLAAGFTRLSLPDWRFRLYTELARFAFAEGHDYWGWRFAGWALHYLQDMAQPYHASAVPGKRAWAILGLYIFGSQQSRDDALVLQSNRHLIFEEYQYGAMADWKGDAAASTLYAALEGKGQAEPPYRVGYLFDVVSQRAFDRGRRLDAIIADSFPAIWVKDPRHDFGVENAGPERSYEPWTGLRKEAAAKAAALDTLTSAIFMDIGNTGRAFLAYASDPAATAGPRKAPLDPRPAAYVLGLVVLIAAVLSLAALRRRRRGPAGRRGSGQG
jgi:hypothetical protein